MNDETQKIFEELLERAVRLLEVCHQINPSDNEDILNIYNDVADLFGPLRSLIQEIIIKYADKIKITWPELGFKDE